MNLNKIAQLYCAFFIIIASPFAHALDIAITNAQGEPLVGAVIGIPEFTHAPVDTQQTLVMDQIDYQFVPRILVANKHQWVDFPNSDDVRHHVYSFSSPKPFEIKMFTGSDAEPIQFNQPGIVVLGCNIHDSMIGYIYVADGVYTVISNEHGIVNIDKTLAALNSTSDKASVSATLWHPSLSASNTERINITLDLNKTHQTLALDTSQNLDEKKPVKNGFTSKFKKRS